ncbi:CDP-alcohol phosphatidyltransferase family protein [Treponema phagedenis]|uniref:CDP-alcohol phosphatidyltransferase family protein n=1 Tax=Treponema phagedenis TaxID=162 RepID=UPI0001F642F5|nr:CDP-alcohol phosphatidyltransferase family protein [Treponema phagedenis]EFW38893.1 CDP-alcohol phosphatidyltransferase [Treponema phagedenis F0421]QEK07987.1 CDP-alcohol phosphatidyltransferase [Treponema phagedenis]TYT78761.1 CDP-alcohol phosphatidyltransferase [Treponema phagedenis]
MTKYSYSAEDVSLLTPPLHKFFVDPLVKVLPYWLPANFITFISNSFILLAFLIAYRGHLNKSYEFWWLIPIFCLLYLIGDYSDGEQARKTHTGSPLGEYFDHFLDSFVTGLLMGVVMISFQVSHPFILTVGFFSLYFGQVTAFWERLTRKKMHFSKFSTSEGIVTIAFFSWITSFEHLRKLTFVPAFFNLKVVEVGIFFLLLTPLLTAILTLIRVKIVSFRLIGHIVLSFFVTVFVSVSFPKDILYLTWVITLYNVLFIASLLAATANQAKEALPEILIPLSFVLFFVFPEQTRMLQYAQCVYLAVRIALRSGVFFHAYKQYWYWINPPKPKEGSIPVASK